MFKLMFLQMFTLLAVGSTGIWVGTDGQPIEVPCPDGVAFNAKVRIPSNCVAYRHGFWLSVEEYKSLKVELAEQAQAIQSKDDLIATLKADLEAQRVNHIVSVAIPDCPICECSTLAPAFKGVLVGAAIITGGCVAWTQFR